MENELSLIKYGQVYSVIRIRRRGSVTAVMRGILDRVAAEPAVTSSLKRYVYTTTHHYLPKFQPIDWLVTPARVLADLEREPRVFLGLEGPTPGMTLLIALHCTLNISEEKVDGKRRKVPEASPDSSVGIHAAAMFFTDSAFISMYVNLLADVFDIAGGEYATAELSKIEHGGDFDRVKRDFFEPSFVAWANLFGPTLVERLGRDLLLSAPAFEVRELPGGSILLLADESPLNQLKPEVQERFARIKSHLGILSPSEKADPEELRAFNARVAARQQEMKLRIEDAFRQARQQAAAEMLRQAEGCAAGAKQFWGVSLDFSPGSLAHVDRMITTGFAADESKDTIDSAVQAFGSYVGEVVRRALGGAWHDQEMKGQPLLVEVGPGKVRVEPFPAVRQRFRQRRGAGADLPAWYRGIAG